MNIKMLTLATAAYALKTYAPADPNAVSGSGFTSAFGFSPGGGGTGSASGSGAGCGSGGG